MSVAESIANAFVRGDMVHFHEHSLKEAIAQGMPDDEPTTDQHVREKLKQFSHLGYVWQVGGVYYEPGIPSLMSYVNTLAQVNAPLSLAEQAGKR